MSSMVARLLAGLIDGLLHNVLDLATLKPSGLSSVDEHFLRRSADSSILLEARLPEIERAVYTCHMTALTNPLFPHGGDSAPYIYIYIHTHTYLSIYLSIYLSLSLSLSLSPTAVF